MHVIVPDFGGGFGGKHGSAVALEAARLARAARRPVRVQWSRADEFTAGYLRPAAVIDVTSSADAAGDLLGWSFTNINSGAVGLATPYRVPHQALRYQPAAAPLPQGSYRALAATANNFARESHMDELADALGIDPVAFRHRHLDDERLAAVLDAAAAEIGWPDGGVAATAPGRVGTGIALGFEKGGRVATAARVHVADDGTLTIRSLVTAVDCGAIVHPDGLANQVEGAVVMGLGPALFEQHRLRRRPDPERVDERLPRAAARRRTRRPARRAARPAGSAVSGRRRSPYHGGRARHRERDLPGLRRPAAVDAASARWQAAAAIPCLSGVPVEE